MIDSHSQPSTPSTDGQVPRAERSRYGVAVLGATGSISVSTLDVLSRHPDRYYTVALTANTDVDILYQQCLTHHPAYAVMADADAAQRLRTKLHAQYPDIEVLSGITGLETVAALPQVDYVMAAIVGAAGLLPTLAAARGGFPQSEEALRALPGIGAYTAAAIAAIAFGRRAVVVDANVERVAARLFAIEAPPPEGKAASRKAIAAVWPRARSGDFAQALMDLGALICAPRAPRCAECPLAEHCRANAAGIAHLLPARRVRAAKPVRRGIAYALFNARGAILFERRPAKGLLGAMPGLPGAPWREGAPQAQPPVDAAWRPAGAVSHAFTHFVLELDVMRAQAPRGFAPAQGQFFLPPDFDGAPTVFVKAAQRAAADARAA